jgi:hypothetical protein
MATAVSVVAPSANEAPLVPSVNNIPAASKVPSVNNIPAASKGPSKNEIPAETPAASRVPYANESPASVNRLANTTRPKESISDNFITQWIILLVFCCVPFLVYAIAPAYGNTIANAAYWTIAIFGSIMCIITAISIMMNIYKSDGTTIMFTMGILGSFIAPVIVISYTGYHIYAYAMSIKSRPYFGLFPFGIYGPEGSFFDSILAPFHDTSKEKGTYATMIADAKSILYGQPRV